MDVKVLDPSSPGCPLPMRAEQTFVHTKRSVDIFGVRRVRTSIALGLNGKRLAWPFLASRTTELLFYLSVIRDAVMAKFKFGEIVGNRARVKPEMLADVDTITAVMLGHDLHPLRSDPGLLKLLNEAVALHWNTVVRAPKLMFRAGQVMQDVPLKICERS